MCSQGDKLEDGLFIRMRRATIKSRTEERETSPIPNVTLMGFSVVICRLAKSTLVLIPLLGVHEILFSFITDDQVEGFSKLIRLFIQLTLSSFHVSKHLNQDSFALKKTKRP